MKLGQLRRISHQMVVALGLPEVPVPAHQPIDFRRRKFFPRPTLLLQCSLFTEKPDQHVNMIRHNHKISKAVTFPIEMMEAIGHNCRHRWLSQETLAMTIIEALVKAFGESLVKLVLLNFGQMLKLKLPIFVIGINAVLPKPDLPVVLPKSDKCGRQRINGSKGDEITGPRLFPVRQVALSDLDLPRWVEEAEGRISG
ncbi:MAG: hypothetical protein NT105_03130 [Verrucomicrobia bacterium]|nr:hypothetical protein [Verrucomicrobiota bacterium]